MKFEGKMRKVELLPTRDCEGGYDPGRSQDMLNGGRETAKEGSEKCMSVMWRPQITQVGLYSH